MSGPVFSFLIVTYNNADSIEMCLCSINEWNSESYEVIVVDNSPGGDTALAVQRFVQSHPEQQVILIQPGDNVGFARGCNMGARRARGEFLFFLNPDTRLANDAAKLLANCFLEHPRALAAGPAIYNRAGHIERTCRNLPNLARILLDATGLDHWLGHYKLTRFQHDVARQVQQIIGAAMLVRRADYERLGGMDECFFIYFEEVDLCKRLLDAGGEIWFWPKARVHHLGGGSCEASPVRARMIFILRESRKKYFVKHFGALYALGLEIINRVEGLQKSLVLALLWTVKRKSTYREKAQGFWAVTTGIAPRP